MTGQTLVCNTQVRTTTTTTTTTTTQAPILLKGGLLPRCAAQLLLALAGSLLVVDGCTCRCWWRLVQCPPPTRAALAFVVATRGAERRGRPHCGPSPQRWPRKEVVTRREERQEGEVHEENDGLRAQTTPLPGTRPAPLPVVAGSQGVARSSSAAGQCGAVGGPASSGGPGGGDGRRCCSVLPLGAVAGGAAAGGRGG